MTHTYCDECLSRLTEKNGALVCTKCGLVNSRIIVDSSYSDPLGRSSRGSQHVFLAETISPLSQLGSFIDFAKSSRFKDAAGNPLTSERNQHFNKLKQTYSARQAHIGKETHRRTLKILSQICLKVGIRRDIQTATTLQYRKLSEEHGDAITNHVLLVALCLVSVVRRIGHNAPFSLKEIITAFRENGNRVSGKTLLRLARELNVPLGGTMARKSEDYVFRIVSNLKKHEKIQWRIHRAGFTPDEYGSLLQRLSFAVLGRIDVRERGGRRPYTFAVSLVYTIEQVIAKLQRRQSILSQTLTASATEVAEFTIRDHSRFLNGAEVRSRIEYVATKLLKIQNN